MAEIDRKAFQKFSLNVSNFCRQDFDTIYLSGNLRRTTTISKTNSNAYQINIPARVYNINLFKKKGIIVYKDEGLTNTRIKKKGVIESGSYADEVNTYSGGFSGKHKNFVEKAIRDATTLLINDLQNKDRKIEIRGIK